MRRNVERFRRNTECRVAAIVGLRYDGLDRCLITGQQSLPNLFYVAAERRDPPAAGDRQPHAARRITDALVPPKPKEFERTVRTAAGCARFATIFSGKSASSKLIFGGRNCSRIASRLITASIAPAAPNEWPIIPLVQLSGTLSKSSVIALPSAASLNGVAVPCALM